MQLNSCTIKGRRSIVEMPNRFRLLPSRHFRRFRRLESGKRRALRFWQKSCRVKSAAFCEVKFKGFYFCLNETWWVSQKISLNSETALHKNHFKSETKCLVCCRRLCTQPMSQKFTFNCFFPSIGRLSKNGDERYFDILTPVKKDRIEVWLVVGFRCTSRSCRSGGCCLYKLTHSTQITVGTLLPSPYSFQKKSLSRNLSLSLKDFLYFCAWRSK